MEQAAKKLKLEEDPFVVLLEELHQNILQHLKGKDILKLFEVSTSWNHRLSASPAAMDKISLQISSLSLLPAVVSMLLKSERKYRNLTSLSKWTNQQSNIDQRLLLLKKFSSTIVRLNFSLYSTLKINKALLDLKFPNLATLTFYLLPVELIQSLITEPPKLQEIWITNCHCQAKSEVIKAIEDKTSLKKLTLLNHQNIFETLNLQNVKFKLNSFELWSVFAHSADNKFSDFLLHFSDTLASLRLLYLPENIAIIFNHLPNLEYLEFGVVEFNDNIKFQPNETIKDIKLRMFTDSSQIALIKKFLLSCKGLENIEFTVSQNSNYKWFVENKQNWKKLKTVNNIEVVTLASYGLSAKQMEKIQKLKFQKFP